MSDCKMSHHALVPRSRIRVLNRASLNTDGAFLLYWMTSSRRTRYNYALQRAIELAVTTGKPLLVFEALRLDYPWSSERHHAFIVQGMREQARDFSAAQVSYLPYVERVAGEGRGLLNLLADEAVAVVTDDFPCFFMGRAQQAAIRNFQTAKARYVESVDSNGIVPMRATDRVFTQARSFRIWWHKNAEAHQWPAAEPLQGYVAGEVKLGRQLAMTLKERWGLSLQTAQSVLSASIDALQFQRDASRVGLLGGGDAARSALHAFLQGHVKDYGQARNHPDDTGSSGLSPYLHFGHLSAHEVLGSLRAASVDSKLEKGVTAFTDQLITWRELGFNFCTYRADYDQLSSLPSWALTTIEAHQNDPRPIRYSFEQLRAAETHDELWNAAQRELLTEGRMHNYLRMLWGKKILEWSPSAQDALEHMVELNNAYALDGRDPNSYSGIFWVLGRYDRAWGPERPIFGKLRYMTSDSARRKLRLRSYLARYTP